MEDFAKGTCSTRLFVNDKYNLSQESDKNIINNFFMFQHYYIIANAENFIKAE